MHNSKVLFFFMCLFFIQNNPCSEVKNATSQLEQTIDSIIIQYQESLKVQEAKLPINDRYLAPLFIGCDYNLLNQVTEKVQAKKKNVYLFIQKNGNFLISAIASLIVRIFDGHKSNTLDSLSDFEQMGFASLIKNLQKTGFFVENNKSIASLINLDFLQENLKKSLDYVKNNIKSSPKLGTFLQVLMSLDAFLREFFSLHYDKDRLINALFEQIEFSKKGVVAQVLDTNARAGNFVIKAGVNTASTVGALLKDKIGVKAFEKTLIQNIELNYKKAMTLYRQVIKNKQESQEEQQVLMDEEKYLAWLITQFNFNALYLYAKPEDAWYLEKITGFLNSKEIKTKINKYIKAVLLGIIPKFEILIKRAYEYYVANTYDIETGLPALSITEKEKIAYEYLYELAKDVFAFQMAIKEVDKELTTLKTFSDLILKYVQSDEVKQVAIKKQKAFLEPLYQMAYFFKAIKLENFDYETILLEIKKIIPEVVVPNDPDLNKKYIPFVPSFISGQLPAPLFWVLQWGFGVATVVTQYSLLYVVKKLYPDIVVDPTKAQGQQLQEAGHKILKKKITPYAKKVLPEPLVDRASDSIAAAVLGSVKNQYDETFSQKPLEKSGLVQPVKEDMELRQPIVDQKGQTVSGALPTKQSVEPNKSFFKRIQDYFASWFAWMWA